jgi:hypothetical protein
MEAFILVILFRMKFLERDAMYGLMVKPMKANGKKIRCTAMAPSFGKMERSTRVTLSMIRERVKVNLLGKMVEFTMANGKMANNMAVENSFLKMV